ncbi:MAG: histidine phosphatase family protein [Chloroflexota bacterium]|nr:histidine phosphatase family protein [Chloroflexota bacterium]
MADPPGIEPSLRTTLVLVRHGESTWVAEGRFQGRGDPPLSPLGRRQAASVAARIAARSAEQSPPLPAGSPLVIWHSPLQRAAATAGAIASAQDIAPPLRPSVGLAEIDQGEWQGLTHHEVRARWARRWVPGVPTRPRHRRPAVSGWSTLNIGCAKR